MQGPMVALLMPFKPSDQTIDDASFIKYLEVISMAHSQCSDAVEDLNPAFKTLNHLCAPAASVARRHQKCRCEWVRLLLFDLSFLDSA